MSVRATGMADFGRAPDGSQVYCIRFCSDEMKAEVTSWGASLKSLHVAGLDNSLVVGLPTLEAYRSEGLYVGAIVGRFANRIKHGHMVLQGREYALNRNEGGKHLLHGGGDGTSTRNWRVADLGVNWVKLEDTLPDGHMGFPGRLSTSVRYSIEQNLTLRIEICACADRETLCNFAPHSYFNLDGSPTAGRHSLQVHANHFLPVDKECIPRGYVEDVRGTRFDLRSPMLLEGVYALGGIDHNFCLSGWECGAPQIKPVAELTSPNNGLSLKVVSNQPGLQVYDGRTLRGEHLRPYCGLALEPQGWPDSINHRDFPSAVLRPGEQYSHLTEYHIVRSEN